MTVQM